MLHKRVPTCAAEAHEHDRTLVSFMGIPALSPEYKLNVAGWPGKGVYILQIRDANKINKIVRKLILR